MSASLCGDCGLPCCSEHEQSYTDDDERSQAVKISGRSGQDSPIALGAVEMASLPLALVCGWAEAEAFAHALPKSLPLLRRHVLAALGHSPPII